MVLDVPRLAGLVVHLDVRRAVPVGLRGDQPLLARVVGEHPARRVGDREREPASRAQHPGDVGDQRRARRRRTAAPRRRENTTSKVVVGERQRGGRAAHRVGRRPRAPRRCGGCAGAGAWRRRARPAGRRGRSTQREHCPAPQPISSTSLPVDVTERPQRRSSRTPLGAPQEAGVAEELAVRGLVLVGVGVPVGTVGQQRLGLVDGRRSGRTPDTVRRLAPAYGVAGRASVGRSRAAGG